jgi:RNA polymerase sigma-B factor
MLRPHRGANRDDPKAHRDEMCKTFVEYRCTRDPRLRDQLVESHAPLAFSAARKFYGRGEELEDLQQVALIALADAVDRFDPSVGARFSTFALATIFGALKRHLRDRTWLVRPPRSVSERGLRVAEIRETLTSTLKRTPRTDEIARVGGWSRQQVDEAMVAFAALRQSDGAPLDDPAVRGLTPHDANGIDAVEKRMMLSQLLQELEPNERHLIELRYLRDRTQTAIASEIGVTPVQIGRLLKDSLAKLQRAAQQHGAMQNGRRSVDLE